MKFNSLTETVVDNGILDSEYKSGRQIGVIRLGETCLMFKSKMKYYYIPYSEIKKSYRRVMGVNMKLCCGRGELRVENLVIADENNNELAVIQLPGTRAAQELIEDLKIKAPQSDFSAPKRDEDGTIISCEAMPNAVEA